MATDGGEIRWPPAGRKRWPPVGRKVAAGGEKPMAIDMAAVNRSPQAACAALVRCQRQGQFLHVCLLIYVLIACTFLSV